MAPLIFVVQANHLRADAPQPFGQINVLRRIGTLAGSAIFVIHVRGTLPFLGRCSRHRRVRAPLAGRIHRVLEGAGNTNPRGLTINICANSSGVKA